MSTLPLQYATPARDRPRLARWPAVTTSIALFAVIGAKWLLANAVLCQNQVYTRHERFANVGSLVERNWVALELFDAAIVIAIMLALTRLLCVTRSCSSAACGLALLIVATFNLAHPWRVWHCLCSVL